MASGKKKELDENWEEKQKIIAAAQTKKKKGYKIIFHYGARGFPPETPIHSSGLREGKLCMHAAGLYPLPALAMHCYIHPVYAHRGFYEKPQRSIQIR